VFVSDLKKVAEYFDIWLSSLARAVYAGGWWWAWKPGTGSRESGVIKDAG